VETFTRSVSLKASIQVCPKVGLLSVNAALSAVYVATESRNSLAVFQILLRFSRSSRIVDIVFTSIKLVDNE
jgi:hypothetical protein